MFYLRNFLFVIPLVFSVNVFSDDLTSQEKDFERDLERVRAAMQSVRHGEEVKNLKRVLDVLNAQFNEEDKKILKIKNISHYERKDVFRKRKEVIKRALLEAKERKMFSEARIHYDSSEESTFHPLLTLEIDSQFYRINFLSDGVMRIAKSVSSGPLANQKTGLAGFVKTVALTEDFKGNYKIFLGRFDLYENLIFRDSINFFTRITPGYEYPQEGSISDINVVRIKVKLREDKNLLYVSRTDLNSPKILLGSFFNNFSFLLEGFQKPHLRVSEDIQKPENESNSESSSEEGSNSQRFSDR